jgi:4,5-dihydroxyphthalate decarboxylase
MTNPAPRSAPDSISVSRRGFLKRGTLAGAALASGVAAGCGMPATQSGKSTAASDAIDLRIAGYPLDRVQALMDGRVQVAGTTHDFEKAPIYDLNSAAMGGDQRWDVQEIGLHPYMLSFANEGFRDYTLIPVFPLRTFRHKSIFVHTGRGITTPEDLRGRKIGTAGYSQSSLTWIRGILQHEYDIHPKDLSWVISRKTSEGGLSGNESILPDDIPITYGPEGKDESELLMEGEVDAVFSAKEPQAYIDGDPEVVRLFADYRRVEHEYYKSTGIFPIMHAVAVRGDVVELHPELPVALFAAYSEAKSLNYAFMRDIGWAMNSLPWYAKELEETRALMGDNFWPYGIGPNRKALEALFQYSHEQGLCERQLTVKELFHPSTLGLLESV